MKALYSITILIFISLPSFGQTFRIYTATTNGNWNNAAIWTSIVRTDNVNENKYIVPANLNVTAPNFNYRTLGNVTVEISGKLTLMANTIFALSPNSSIQVMAGGAIETVRASAIMIGNSLKFISFAARTFAGPVFTNYPTTGFAASTLAVRFIGFTASLENNNMVLLQWTTSDEINNKHFEVEFSNDGKNWNTIGIVKAAFANSPVNKYNYSHRTLVPVASYRLKQVDMDGKFEYSMVTVVRNNSSSNADIFVSGKQVNINLNGNNKTDVIVNIMNMSGQLLIRSSFKPYSKIAINVNQLKTGMYVVQLTDNNKLTHAKTVQVN